MRQYGLCSVGLPETVISPERLSISVHSFIQLQRFFFVSGMPETMVKVWDIGRRQIAVKGSIVSCLDHLYVDGTPIQLAALSAGY